MFILRHSWPDQRPALRAEKFAITANNRGILTISFFADSSNTIVYDAYLGNFTHGTACEAALGEAVGRGSINDSVVSITLNRTL